MERSISGPASPDENYFRSIFEALTDAVLVTDLEGTILEVNPAACHMYGYDRDELVGINATLLVHPDARCLFEESFQDFKLGEPLHIEAVDVRKDGTAFPVEVYAVDITLKESPHLVAIVRDISERRQTENALRSLVEGTSAVTGDEFFRSLARHLSLALEVRYGFVGECIEDKTKVRTLAFWIGDGLMENFEYEVKGTPCAEVTKLSPSVVM